MKSKLLVSTIVTTILIISLINLVSAVRLDTGTILNTSESNSSMTFSVPIDVDRAVVESTQITLTNIVCSNGVTSSEINIVWDTPNTNRDSVSYCFLGCSATTRTGYSLVMLLSSVAILVFVSMFVWKKFKDGDIAIRDFILLFINIIVVLVLWTASGQNLGNSCGVIS